MNMDCIFCGKHVNNVGTLSVHIEDIHYDLIKKCPLCNRGAKQYNNGKLAGYRDMSRRGLYRHCLKIGDKIHLALAYILSGSYAKTISRSEMRKAYADNKDNLVAIINKRLHIFQCIFCNKTFGRVDILSKHIDNEHKEEIKVCPICKRGAARVYSNGRTYYRDIKNRIGLYKHCVFEGGKNDDKLHLALARLLCGGLGRRSKRVKRMRMIKAYDENKEKLINIIKSNTC